MSCAELDLLVDIAAQVKGVIGTRMTGAGFGGSTVNLVRRKVIPRFRERVYEVYPRPTGLTPDLHVCAPVTGVRRL